MITVFRDHTFWAMKSAKQILTLNQFMIRGQVLKQYRDFLRTAKRIPDKSSQEVTITLDNSRILINSFKDVIDWVRKDFKQYSALPNSEEDQIKSLLKYGEKMLKDLKQNVDFSTAS